ncbi:hypothetical protein ACSQ67_022112 [Phaseolus vulgaris]
MCYLCCSSVFDLLFVLVFLKKHSGSSMEAFDFGITNGTATGSRDSELKGLQKEHEEKSVKNEELKKQIELTKCRLEKKKKEVTEEERGGFNSLSKKYNSLREEYNAMVVAGKLTKSK